MKILYHHRIGSKDGQYVHITEIINAFESLGHEVILVGPKVMDSQSFGGESGWVVKLKHYLPRAPYEIIELAYSFVDYMAMRGVIRDHNPDFIYERYNLYFVSGVWARRRFHLPYLVEVNSPLKDERSKYGKLSLKRLARWSERRVWRSADHIFTVTSVLAERISEELDSPKNISVTPNGIDPTQFIDLPSRSEAKRRLGVEHRVVLGFVGFVREWHGLEKVIDLMSERPQLPLQLVLVGDGPAKRLLERHASSCGVSEQLTFVGVVAREQIADYIAAFDIALQPSVVSYASPLKLFEYMAAGCAIVAPDTNNIREILNHDVNALLFVPGDSNALSAQVARLASDPALCERLGESARRTITDRDLTWTGNAKAVLSVAHKLLEGQSGAGGGIARPRIVRGQP